MQNPSAVFVDALGHVYIADGANNRIRKITNGSAGFTDLNNSQTISLYPNPSNGKFEVKCEKDEVRSIKIFNALGEVVYNVNTNSIKSTVDITNQANGIYLLQVITDKGTTQHRIVKQ